MGSEAGDLFSISPPRHVAELLFQLVAPCLARGNTSHFRSLASISGLSQFRVPQGWRKKVRKNSKKNLRSLRLRGIDVTVAA